MKYLIGITIILIISTANGNALNLPAEKDIFQNSHLHSELDSLLVLQRHDSLLESFYRSNNFKLFWNSRAARQTALNVIADASSEGLNPADYSVEALQAFENQYDRLPAGQLDDYDIQLTHSLQKYLAHIINGKLDPNQIYDDWILPRQEVNVNDIIIANASAPNFIEIINNLKPQHHFYRSLKVALQEIQKVPLNEVIDTIRITKKIILNENRDVLPLIKKRLRQWNDLKTTDSLTTEYDLATVEAVKNFQRRHGLKQDGIIGPATADALNISPESRRKSIIANLERWRWYPRDLGSHYLMVNIPAFKLAIIRDGDTVETKKIIVGTNDRRTPILTSKFSNITLNPTWTVPPTILREDIVPSAIKNRGYFYEKRITIYDGNNRVISPWQWKPDKATSYRYVQSPGTHNALGTVKFNFPNNKMVYLHDTNTRSLYSQNYRSLSSGCVR
ncbi:MAG TPA: L,D-transpeptidase family protein, partial [Flavobacterium sp.]|nr:L,D-transpeptidase family protein [Flavobacterium sp.]